MKIIDWYRDFIHKNNIPIPPNCVATRMKAFCEMGMWGTRMEDAWFPIPMKPNRDYFLSIAITTTTKLILPLSHNRGIPHMNQDQGY